LPKDRIPVAKLLWQITPRRTGSHQPKHRIQHAAMVGRRATAVMDQESFEIRPLIVGHQSANQGRSPQREALNQFPILASIDLSTRPSRTRTLSQAVRRYWFKVTRQKDHHQNHAAGVFLHDPGAQRPHDLDDPFYDPKVQARVGDAISRATQKK
jgi:hypothetical protein